jgi:sec-independent protein translocase protein TatA
MGALSPWHLILILGIVLLVVGPGKLPEVGAALGKTIKELRESLGPLEEASNEVRSTLDPLRKLSDEVRGNLDPLAGPVVAPSGGPPASRSSPGAPVASAPAATDDQRPTAPPA